jgi:P4 family phage/plasmid primase-like protien
MKPDEGALICRQCFSKHNGDGIAALGWLLDKPMPLKGKDFTETAKLICDYLGVSSNGSHKKNGKAEKPKVFCTPAGIVRYFIESLEKLHGRGVKHAGTWTYDTFHVLRFNLPTAPGEKQRKEFRPVHQVPLGLSGGKGWQGGYPPGQRPIYRRMEAEAAPSDLIAVHGGEKAADAARTLGVASTTNAGGEKAGDHTDWTPVFRFKTVAIVTDNDPAGESFGQMLAAKFRIAKPDIDVRIIKLPDLPPKGDIVEWIAAGGTKAKFLEIVADTAPATKLDLSPEEADDDPHRLAKVFLDGYSTYQKIIYWRGEYWCWDKYYRLIFNLDIQSEVTKAIKAEFNRINIESQIETAFKSSQDEKEKPKAKKVTRKLVSDVANALNSIILLNGAVDQQTWIDGTHRPNCVTVENCILDLDAFVGRRDDWNLDHTPNWFSPIYLPYKIDTTCKECASPLWDRFMDRALEGDQQRIMTLQEWMGYCLTHDTSLQRFIMLEGEGGGGKSTFCAALIAVLGRQNVAHIPLERFGDKFTLSTTLGKLANIAAECGELDKAAEGTLKSFTSGDRMSFEKKNQQPFFAMPTARLILAANNRPRFADRSSGLWRRMIVVPFNAKLDGDGRTLGMDKAEFWEKSGELPGIFWWAVLGLHRLREQGDFTVSKISKDAIEEYRLESNPARNFLVENCQEATANRMSCSDMYTAYAVWCKNKGYHQLGEAQFGREVYRVYPRSQKKRIGKRGDRFHVYEGVELLENEQSEF